MSRRFGIVSSWLFTSLAALTGWLSDPGAAWAQGTCPLPISEQRDAITAFRALVPVFQHPRCANCHGALNVFVENTVHEGGFMGETTRMTDPFTDEVMIDIRIPHPDQQRGICVQCHDEAGREWRQQTGGDVQWAGQPAAELCRRMKSTPIMMAVNTPGGMLAHMRDDMLVKLGFQGRAGGANYTRMCPGSPECVPMTHADFVAGIQGWIDAVSEAGAWLGDPDCGCVLDVEESVVLVVDVSGSMNDNGKLGAAQEAARAVIGEFLGPGAATAPPVEFGILTYSGSCGSTFPFTPFSQDADELAGVVGGFSAGGGTPMTPALYQARQRIWSEGSGKAGKIVLLTDGQNDCSGSPVEAAKRIFEKREEGVPVAPQGQGPGGPRWWAWFAPRDALAQSPLDALVDPVRKAMPITVSTIGFQVTDRQQAELDAIAAAGGGVSLRAENAGQLAAAFRRAVAGPAVVAGGGGGGGARRSMPGAATLTLIALGLVALGLVGALAVARSRRSALAAVPGAPTPDGIRIELSLVVHDPGGPARRISFQHAPVSIGRDPSNDLVLTDPEASRRHARIVADDAGLWIEDLGSSGGTIVDGRRVPRAELRQGAEISLGSTRLVIG